MPHKPIVVATWAGSDPSLPAILLNSHYDVVPAVLDHWHTDPFTPTRKDGRIYARGTQDMKVIVVGPARVRTGIAQHALPAHTH